MTADLRSSGNFPFINDKFTILVIMGRSSLTHFFSNHVGMGSREHVEDGDFIIMSRTVSSDINEKSENEESHWSETKKEKNPVHLSGQDFV